MSSQLPPPLPRSSRLAWASLFLGVVANMVLPVIASIPGIICGHLALRAMRRDPTLMGLKMAKTGLVLGYVSIAAGILLVLLWMILMPLLHDIMPTLRETFPTIPNWF